MLELIKFLVDAFVKAVPGIAGKRRAAKWADLGTRLFMLYTLCNEMLLRGERIVVLLEELDTRGSVVDPSRMRLLPQYWEVTRLMFEQGKEIARVQETIDEWASHVQILSGIAYNRLVITVNIKGADIKWIVCRVTDHGGPKTIRIDDVDVVPRGIVAEVSPETVSDTPSQYLLEDAHYLSYFVPPMYAEERVVAEADAALAMIRLYLTDRDPKAGLTLIRDSLDQFRAALIQNFKLEDILPRIKNKR